MQTLRELSDKDLITEIKTLVSQEKQNVLRQIVLLRELMDRKIHIKVGYSSFAQFCEEKLGISKNQAWKRCQAAMVTRFYPSVKKMLEAGETTVSCVAAVNAKITQANELAILDGIRGKSKKEVEFFLSTIDHSGNRIDREPTLEFRLNLTRSQMDKLERVRRILGQNKKAISIEEIVEEALENLLDKKDPERKAQRAMERQEAKAEASLKRAESSQNNHPDESVPDRTFLGKADSRHIPAAARHLVTMRDQNQCTYLNPDGSRCQERHGLQIDHKTPFCRGGSHDPSNLRLLCKSHNNWLAGELLGHDFMRMKTAPGKLVTS